MNAAAFSLDVDVEVDSSPTQASRRRAHIREISRVRATAIVLTIALAFTSGLGAALAVQLARTGGSATVHERSPRTVVARASTLRIIDGAAEKHFVPAADDKPTRGGRKSARTRRAPSAPASAPAEASSEVLLPAELLDRGIVNVSAPDATPSP